jgi:uncharacterized protein YecE (DUF72 family)
LSGARRVLVGTAGWSVPRASRPSFPAEGTGLCRYAAVFRALEINSTFYRPHQGATFARWAGSVPPGFRFSVKMPRAITHERGLDNTAPLLDEFLAQIEPLGSKLGCLLVQLPPKLELDLAIARRFFKALRSRVETDVALEPRHATWFTEEAHEMLVRFRVARVAADPPRGTTGLEPGGWSELAYFRLHGSPRIYFSSYDDAYLDALTARLRGLARQGTRCWCIFDNTTLGAATANGLGLVERLRSRTR